MHNHEDGGGKTGGHDHGHGHSHGNENDRGPAAMLRYARNARSMWTSSVNDAVIARLKPEGNETVVDIGAGVGAGSIVAAERAALVIAVEPTPYMRRILKMRTMLGRKGARVQIVDGSAEQTGLASDSVDAAWAVNTMHHWTDPASAAHELFRILRPGGRILLADEDFDDPTHPSYGKFKERNEGHHHAFDMVELDTIAELLASAGLEVSTSAKQTLAGAPTLTIEATKPEHRTS